MENQNVLIGARVKLPATDILCLMGEANYSYVYLKDGSKILVSTTLKILENRFQSHGFFRVHKSALVNLSYIETYVYNDNGGELCLPQNLNIPVSRRKNKVLQTLITGCNQAS
jgi:two-component system, LytTR family, response regulator